MADWQPSPDQSRSVLPDREGFANQGGVRIFFEVYGEAERDPRAGLADPPTLLFVPPWAIVHSRAWKAQIGYLSRHFRLIVFDPRANGRSDKPTHPDAYSEDEQARDIAAVLDAADVDRVSIVSLSRGAQRSLIFAADHPERVASMVFIGPSLALSARAIAGGLAATQSVLRSPDPGDEALPGLGWFNREAWLRDEKHHRSFVTWFVERCFEPHSTKLIEDAIAWGLEPGPEVLAATQLAEIFTGERTRELAGRLQCPVLCIHGDADRICDIEESRTFCKLVGAELEVVEGSGHLPQARKPVQVNHAIRAFVDPGWKRDATRRRRRTSARKKVLFVCSPIGLGHARRDLAIARELEQQRPDLDIEWLAQHPVTRVLEAEGETIHPASAALASESKHIECESAEHDLHCFQALRRMDEILIHNFMVYDDVMRSGEYDLTIGDEAWELDYYLHENPRQKQSPFVWLTDFVGFVPMQSGGDHEAFLTADYNAEMIEHVASHPEVRDRAIFVGNPEDVVDLSFGPALPMIRDWTCSHFDFAGYVTGFDPERLGDRRSLRAELGYHDHEKVCVVSVGGSGVGLDLLRKVIDAFPEARRLEPALRMQVVAGPRIDTARLPRAEGLEVVPYVHDLYRNLAACDVAVVQGGLTTAMELTATRRPFLYFPLRHHFEQNVHVRHRLENYGAGRCMSYEHSGRQQIAEAIAEEIARPVDYRPVETDGARVAATRIAELM